MIFISLFLLKKFPLAMLACHFAGVAAAATIH